MRGLKNENERSDPETLQRHPHSLEARFANTVLPNYWFAQDGEAYLELAVEQRLLQDFNCANAKFMQAAIFGASDLWATYGEAVVQEINPDGNAVNTRLLIDGRPVGVFADDTLARGQWPGVLNPKAADSGKVARRAWEHFKLTNTEGAGEMPAEWTGTPPPN